MRRIALTAALAATLAGGAAALAATPDAGTPNAAPPDPYQGAWALMVDGKPAGPVLNVDGCDLKAQVVAEAHATTKHVAAVAPEPCTFDAGAGMSPAFYAWLNGALQDDAAAHEAELVRTDARAGYGLALTHATVAEVALPRIDRASTAPAFLRVALAAERVSRVPATAPGPVRVRPLMPSTLAVSVGGQPLGASSVGPWAAEIQASGGVGEVRDHQPLPQTVDVGDLPVRVPEAGKSGLPAFDAWVKSGLVDGATAERPVTVSLSGLTLQLAGAGPARADLAARADGTRSYDLYAERAGLVTG